MEWENYLGLLALLIAVTHLIVYITRECTRIQVRLYTSAQVPISPMILKQTDSLTVTVINKSGIAFNLKSLDYYVKGSKERLFFLPNLYFLNQFNMPTKIEPRDSKTFNIVYDECISALNEKGYKNIIKLQAIAISGISKEYRSNYINIHIKQH